jgi:hypothetical protein
MSNHIEYLVHILQPDFDVACHAVGIAECSIFVVVMPGVLIISRDILSNARIWTLLPKTHLPLEII